jgi:hypothetical protein
MQTTVFLFIALSIVPLEAFSQNLRQNALVPFQQIQPTAQKSLDTFRSLVTQENYKQMGFDSAEEIRSAILDTPIVDYLVRLDRLKEYLPENNPDSLLTATNQLLYPVLVRRTVKSSLTLSKIKEQWQVVSFGNTNLTKTISRTLATNMKTTGVSRLSYFTVRVPALNLVFLGYRLNNRLMLIPVMDNARLEFTAGTSLPGETVFARLLPEARTHDGQPR